MKEKQMIVVQVAIVGAITGGMNTNPNFRFIHELETRSIPNNRDHINRRTLKQIKGIRGSMDNKNHNPQQLRQNIIKS